MRDAIVCAIIFVSQFGLAQTDGSLQLRHARIDSLYNSEDYEQLILLIDQQWDEAQTTKWTDSLYQYTYEYGRAIWKTKGDDQGVAGVQSYLNRVIEIDSNAEHVLSAYTDVSWLLYDLGRMRDCLTVDSTAYAYALDHKELPRYMVAKKLTHIGFDQRSLGLDIKAIDYYQQAIAMYESEGDFPDRHTSLSSAYTALGACQWNAGQMKEAEKNYLLAIAQLKGREDPESVSFRSSTYGNLSLLAESQGRMVEAKEYAQRTEDSWLHALQLADEPDKREEIIYGLSRCYSNVAALYFSAGELDISASYLDKAMEYRSQVLEEDDVRIAFLKGQRASIEIALANYQEADSLMTGYFEACKEAYGMRGDNTSYALRKLADIKSYQEKHNEADSLMNLILADPEAIGYSSLDPDLGLAYVKMAEIDLGRDRYQAGLIVIGKAIEIYQEAYPAEHYKHYEARELRARLLALSGQSTEALIAFSDLIEDMKAARASKALGDFESPRPSLLPETIAQKARIGIAEPNSKREDILLISAELDEAISIIQQDLRVFKGETAQLNYSGQMSEVFDLSQLADYQLHELDDDQALVERIFARSEINKAILLKGQLNSIEGLSFGNVPDSLVNKEKVLQARLSEGLLGEGLSYDEAERAYGSLLEKLEQDYPRYYDLKYSDHSIGIKDIQNELLKPDQTLISYSLNEEGALAVVIDGSQAQVVRLASDDLRERLSVLLQAVTARDLDSYLESAHELCTLLFEPLKQFVNTKEILIVPDDELYRLNFEILLDEPSTAVDFTEHLLLNRYTISTILSATTSLQFERLGQKKGKGVLAFAPGFSDELKAEYRANISEGSSYDEDYMGLARQPFAVSTAQVLGDQHSAQVMIGSEAAEDDFKNMASEYGVIHLGTHTQVNDVSPLFSKLVMSKGKDDSEDGYLHAFEIYELQLEAELAVLTACETGAGRTDRAEGLRSLAHGFAYAGCPSIVMSLWDIDEKSSAEIVNSFYGYLAGGKPKNEALRQAKLDFIQSNPELRAPYYWAGIVLMGDVSPIAISDNYDWRYLIGAIVVILLLFLLYRKIK